MKSIQKKLLAAGFVVISAAAYLAFAGAKQGWAYYVTVDQFTRDAAKYGNQRVKLCGTVSGEGLEVNRGRLTAKFVLESDQGGKVSVVYRGTIPDMFRADCQAVVEGRMNAASGVFEAETLLTKCASKYEADHGNKAPHGLPAAHTTAAAVEVMK
jgi:cytochrome c-type biogenesis protein CcmE